MAQCDSSALITNPIKVIIDSDDNWEIIDLGRIYTIRYKPHFLTKAKSNERKRMPHSMSPIDSAGGLFIGLTFEPDWNDSLLIHRREIRTKYIDSVTAEYIDYHDSTGWPDNLSKKQFLKNPIHYCSLRNFKVVGNNAVFYETIDLPDFVVGDCGVKYGSSLYFKTKRILDKKAKSDIKKMLVKLSKTNPDLERVIKQKQHNGSW